MSSRFLIIALLSAVLKTVDNTIFSACTEIPGVTFANAAPRPRAPSMPTIPKLPKSSTRKSQTTVVSSGGTSRKTPMDTGGSPSNTQTVNKSQTVDSAATTPRKPTPDTPDANPVATTPNKSPTPDAPNTNINSSPFKRNTSDNNSMFGGGSFNRNNSNVSDSAYVPFNSTTLNRQNSNSMSPSASAPSAPALSAPMSGNTSSYGRPNQPDVGGAGVPASGNSYSRTNDGADAPANANANPYGRTDNKVSTDVDSANSNPYDRNERDPYNNHRDENGQQKTLADGTKVDVYGNKLAPEGHYIDTSGKVVKNTSTTIDKVMMGAGLLMMIPALGAMIPRGGGEEELAPVRRLRGDVHAMYDASLVDSYTPVVDSYGLYSDEASVLDQSILDTLNRY